MADEIKITLSVNYVNGSAKDTFVPGQIAVDQATQGLHKQIVEVGTSQEDMPVGDIGTEGILVLQNLDSTNYVDWGADSADSSGTTGVMEAIGRLKAGEIAIFRMYPNKQLRWQANTAEVRVLMILFED